MTNNVQKKATKFGFNLINTIKCQLEQFAYGTIPLTTI